MARFSLSVLLLASCAVSGMGAHRHALRSRYLQEAAANTTAAATPHDNTTAAATPHDNSTTAATPHDNSTTAATVPHDAANGTTKSDLPACRDSFPGGHPPKFVKAGGAEPATDPASFFEANKEQPYLKHALAKLAPCLLDDNQCHDSVAKVDTLTGALSSVTQQLFNAAMASSAHNNTTTADNATAAKQDAAPAAPPAVAVSPSTAPADGTATPHAAAPAGDNTTAAHHDNTTATPHAAPAPHPNTTHPDNTTTTAHHDNTTTTTHHDNTTAAAPHPDNTTAATPHAAAPPADTPAAPAATTPAAAAPAAPAAGGDAVASFADSLAKAPQLKAVLDEHAACVASQPGGSDAFLQHYSTLVKDLLHGGSNLTTATAPSQ